MTEKIRQILISYNQLWPQCEEIHQLKFCSSRNAFAFYKLFTISQSLSNASLISGLYQMKLECVIKSTDLPWYFEVTSDI